MNTKTKENTMANKKLPVKLIVRRYKEKPVDLVIPPARKYRINPGVNEITDQDVIRSVYDENINQGWLTNIRKGIHEVEEAF